MELIPIKQTLEENEEFTTNPICGETIFVTIDFYKKVGFAPPWISYYVRQNENLVGCAAFKGGPVNGMVEIAYGVFEKYRRQGVGGIICKLLVDLSLATDPSVKITARTLPEKNFSARLLEKNNFDFRGTIIDPEDGQVWEWIYNPSKKIQINRHFYF